MFSVIIPSRNIQNLVPCVEAVRRNEPEARIINVWHTHGEYAPELQGVDVRYVREPWCFSKAVNIGIRAAGSGSDDVVILGDDGLLQTPGGFSLLAREAEAHPEFGIISSTVSNVGNPNQWPAQNWHRPELIGTRPEDVLREEPRVVCFIAVYIPRQTIETVGLLDERFTAYGFDDDDYCLRIRRAGLKIGIHDGCFVDHSSLKSTFRGNPAAPANLVDGRAIFVEKWGSHPL